MPSHDSPGPYRASQSYEGWVSILTAARSTAEMLRAILEAAGVHPVTRPDPESFPAGLGTDSDWELLTPVDESKEARELLSGWEDGPGRVRFR